MRPDRRQFGGAALLVGAALSLACSPPSLQGRWDAVVVVNDVDIPFRFDIVESTSGVSGVFFNGAERIESSSGRMSDGTLTLSYDHYATRLEARLVDGQLEGQYLRARGAPYPFRARAATEAAATAAEVPSIGGLWHIPIKSSKNEAAWRFIVHQTGPDISAAILRVDGDTGALTGRYQDGRFVLSHFSGQRPALMEITVESDGTLAILQNRRTKMTAVREQEAAARLVAEPTDPSRHSFARSRTEPFIFAFPDVDGRMVSSADARFRNKVVIISITGTWCPNCHDEAPFLTDLYQRYRGLGLEIVGLSFEEEAQLQNPARLRAYAVRYGIEYPMLLAGVPEQLAERVPQIENLNSFPTTIFLGRDGVVRDVHAGFPSKASGRFYSDTVDSITGMVERLLTEAADTAASSSGQP
jgi:peroxiredoxin